MNSKILFVAVGCPHEVHDYIQKRNWPLWIMSTYSDLKPGVITDPENTIVLIGIKASSSPLENWFPGWKKEISSQAVYLGYIPEGTNGNDGWAYAYVEAGCDFVITLSQMNHDCLESIALLSELDDNPRSRPVFNYTKALTEANKWICKNPKLSKAFTTIAERIYPSPQKSL